MMEPIPIDPIIKKVKNYKIEDIKGKIDLTIKK